MLVTNRSPLKNDEKINKNQPGKVRIVSISIEWW